MNDIGTTVNHPSTKTSIPNEKLRILYLVNRYYYESKMSRGARFHTLEAVGRRDDVELIWWGKGWPGYEPTQSLSWNIGWMEAKHGYFSDKPFFDLVVVYKPEDHIGVREFPVPKAITYNECWPDSKPNRAQQEVEACGASLIVVHHEGDLAFFDHSDTTRRIVHIPHGADKAIFYRPEDECSRDIPVLVAGVQSKDIYPLRHRCAELIRSKRLPGEIRNHPGYRLKSREECERQFADYAAHLRRAKIVLTCSSKYRYPLAKYIEAAMAGCLVIGDMPCDSKYWDTIGRHLGGPLKANASGDEIEGVVKFYLQNESARREIAEQGQRAALEHGTMELYAERFVAAAREMLAERNVEQRQ